MEKAASNLLCQRCRHSDSVVRTDSCVHVVCRHSDAYPSRLLDLDTSPTYLYICGDPERLCWLKEECATVVGSRRPTAYGRSVARDLASDLSRSGLTVVSGMAMGVDSEVHRGALEACGGKTVAVLASGAERAYPRSSLTLYELLVEKGLVISEAPPGTSVYRSLFPARNRLMAALGLMSIIVEARRRSGSLITARLALDLGRDVGAVPGPVTSRLSDGPNALIADGAKLVSSARDVLDATVGVTATLPDTAPQPQLNPLEQTLIETIRDGFNTVDQIAARGGKPAQIVARLAELEIRGVVRRALDGSYVCILRS